MSDEAPPAEEKPKKPIVKIILAVVALIVLVVAVMMGTLFMTGFFSSKPAESADEMLASDGSGHGAAPANSGHGAPKADAGHGAPKADAKHGDKKADPKADPKAATGKKSPEVARFEYTYHQLEREFLVNLSGSKKVMSVQIAIMTHYDERVITNVKKHDFALRSVIMDVMRQTTEADLVKPEFRKELAVKLRDAINTLVEKYEDFGGVEEVHFTSFIVQ